MEANAKEGNATMNNADFNTTKYEWTYGRKPRGFGWWHFENRATAEVAEYVGTYSEAKRKCAKEFPGQTFNVCT
jgi:hypothetical protein